MESAYKEAMLAGSQEATSALAAYYAGKGEWNTVRQLADMANADAAYLFGLKNVEQNNELAEKYIKIASALEHEQASADLAELVWRRLIPTTRQSDDGKIFSTNPQLLKDVYFIYNRIAEDAFMENIRWDIPDFKERLAFIKFLNNEWREARELFADNPHTAEGLYALAVMYKLGLGGQRSRNRRLEFIKRAASSNGLYAAMAENIKYAWYHEELMAFLSEADSSIISDDIFDEPYLCGFDWEMLLSIREDLNYTFRQKDNQHLAEQAFVWAIKHIDDLKNSSYFLPSLKQAFLYLISVSAKWQDNPDYKLLFHTIWLARHDLHQWDAYGSTGRSKILEWIDKHGSEELGLKEFAEKIGYLED